MLEFVMKSFEKVLYVDTRIGAFQTSENSVCRTQLL